MKYNESIVSTVEGGGGVGGLDFHFGGFTSYDCWRSFREESGKSIRADANICAIRNGGQKKGQQFVQEMLQTNNELDETST